jgi:hypothetical protein
MVIMEHKQYKHTVQQNLTECTAVNNLVAMVTMEHKQYKHTV